MSEHAESEQAPLPKRLKDLINTFYDKGYAKRVQKRYDEAVQTGKEGMKRFIAEHPPVRMTGAHDLLEEPEGNVPLRAQWLLALAGAAESQGKLQQLFASGVKELPIQGMGSTVSTEANLYTSVHPDVLVDSLIREGNYPDALLLVQTIYDELRGLVAPTHATGFRKAFTMGMNAEGEDREMALSIADDSLTSLTMFRQLRNSIEPLIAALDRKIGLDHIHHNPHIDSAHQAIIEDFARRNGYANHPEVVKALQPIQPPDPIADLRRLAAEYTEKVNAELAPLLQMMNPPGEIPPAESAAPEE
jgi:hypothetical protein